MEVAKINIDRTGRRIRILMDLAGLSVKDVCEQLGLASVQSVYHWLHGRNLPAVDNLYALGMLLKIPMDAIVCGDGREMKSTECMEISSLDFREGLDSGERRPAGTAASSHTVACVSSSPSGTRWMSMVMRMRWSGKSTGLAQGRCGRACRRSGTARSMTMDGCMGKIKD